VKIDLSRGYLSNGRRMWGWVVTTARGQLFIGIKVKVEK